MINNDIDINILMEELYNEIYNQLSEQEKQETNTLANTNPVRGTKFVAEHTGCGLKEAKCVIDYIRETNNEKIV